jgi:hypothetical protein
MANYVSSFANGAAVDAELTKVANSNLSATHKITRSATIVIAASDSSAKSKAQADHVTDNLDDGTVQTLITSAAYGKVVFVSGATGFLKTVATGLILPSNIEIELIGKMKLADGLNTDACFWKNSDQTNGNTSIVLSGGANAIYDCNRLGQSSGYQYLADFCKVNSGEINAYITNYSVIEAKLKESSVTLKNHRFNVKPICLSKCESLDDFTVAAGTGSIVSDGVDGGNAVRVVSSATSARLDFVLPDDIDAEAYILNFWIRVDDITKAKFIRIGGDTPTGSYHFDDTVDTSYNMKKLIASNTFTHIQTPLTYYTTITPGKKTLRLRVDPIEGNTVTVDFDEIWLVPSNDLPKLSLIFDDAIEDTNRSTIQAAQIMSKYRGRGSTGQMGSDYIGDVYLSQAELDMLYSQYGWDISTHGSVHMDTISTTESAHQIFSVSKFLTRMGYIRGSNFYVYPGHDTTPEVNQIVSKMFRAYRNPCQNLIFDWATNKLSFAWQVGLAATSYTPSAAELDAMRRHIWYCAYSHYIGFTEDDVWQMHPEWLESFCSFWYDWGVIIQPPSEVLQDYTCPHLADETYKLENVGTAKITTGQTSVDITHGLAAAPTRVQLTPTTATAGKDYYVSAKAASTFTITIDSAAEADISFDWQAVI